MAVSLGKYRKLWVALAGAVLTVVFQYFSDVEWLQSVVPFLTAVGIYQVPNDLGGSSRKR